MSLSVFNLFNVSDGGIKCRRLYYYDYYDYNFDRHFFVISCRLLSLEVSDNPRLRNDVVKVDFVMFAVVIVD